MAVELGPLVSAAKETISFDNLTDKVVAIDAYNTIYQFITIIRQQNGMPLSDSHGMITSHLSGLFYRTINLLEHRITPVFVFDGMPPALKQKTIAARVSRREEEAKEWSAALEKGMLEEARRHAIGSARITKEIVASSKELLKHMGVAYIQAPGEGEAQAARMVKEKAVYASASQDYDLFLFGSDVIVRNLTITGRRKLPMKNVYVEVTPERFLLKNVLSNLGISQKQLIWLGMLVGTDFNEGIKGVGPKTALKIVKEIKTLHEVAAYVKEKYKVDFETDPAEIEAVFSKPETETVSKEVANSMKGTRPDKEGIMRFMCGAHDFSEERVGKFADTLLRLKERTGQKSMGDWS